MDHIEDYEPGEFAVGYKCVTYREDFFKGHFPQEPVMPGVLTVEALAQVGAVAILVETGEQRKNGVFRGNLEMQIPGKGSARRQAKAGNEDHKAEGPARNRRGDCQCGRKHSGKRRIDIYGWIGE